VGGTLFPAADLKERMHSAGRMHGGVTSCCR